MTTPTRDKFWAQRMKIIRTLTAMKMKDLWVYISIIAPNRWTLALTNPYNSNTYSNRFFIEDNKISRELIPALESTVRPALRTQTRVAMWTERGAQGVRHLIPRHEEKCWEDSLLSRHPISTRLDALFFAQPMNTFGILLLILINSIEIYSRRVCATPLMSDRW